MLPRTLDKVEDIHLATLEAGVEWDLAVGLVDSAASRSSYG